MVKVCVLLSVCMMCTISLAWGCVTGAGPSWEINQPGRPDPGGRPGPPGPGGRPGPGVRPGPGGRPGPGVRPVPGVVGPGGPLGKPGNKGQPTRIPTEVLLYFAGGMSKEEAFESIDLDGNGLVSLEEWTLSGGATREFDHMLIRLDIDGDSLISLVELQPFSLPTELDSDVTPRLINPKLIATKPTPKGQTDPRGLIGPRGPIHVDPVRGPVGPNGPFRPLYPRALP